MAKPLACRVCRAGKYCQMCHKSNECGSRCSTPKSCLEGLPFMELMSRGYMLRAEFTQDERDLYTLIGTPASDTSFKSALERADVATINAALDAIVGKPETKTKELALRRRLKKLIQSTTTDGGKDMGRKLPAVPVSEAEKKDPALHMEMETLRAERDERLNAEEEQADREKRIAEAHEIAGRIQAFSFVEKVLTVGVLMQLRQIKEAKTYRDLPNIGTWEKYCNYLGFSRQKVDEDMANLATFGEEFLQTVGGFGLGYREMKKLRQLTHDGTVQVVEDAITIGSETIPIDPEHAEDLKAAIDWIIDENKSITARVKKLEKNLKAAVDEETKSFESEKKSLLERIQKLEIYEPDQKDREWCVKQMAAIEEAAGAMQIAIAKFVIDPRLEDDRHLQAKVNAHLQEAELALQDVRGRVDEVIDMFN